MCHAEREEVYAWLAEHGGTPDSPETLRDKVKVARADASHASAVTGSAGT